MRIHTNDLQLGQKCEAAVFGHLWQRVVMNMQHEFLYQASKIGHFMKTEINADGISF